MALLDDLHSSAASLFRVPRGMSVRDHCQQHPPRPDELLVMYEFEGCPFCRKVREAMSELDLAYVNRTCPPGDQVKRPELESRGGKQQFPYLIDPNTGTEMYESEDIIDYLFETYGPKRSGIGRALAPVNTFGASWASLVRPKGRAVRPGCADREQPERRLVLYNFEISPYCRKVREALCELNLDYAVRNVAKGSERRPELVERGGQMMVPYLIDPNTDTEMYESDDIVEYLEATYG